MPNNIQLMMEFCDKNYEEFQNFIEDEYEIEPTEAELILKNVSKTVQDQE
jgi:hypothetical protein